MKIYGACVVAISVEDKDYILLARVDHIRVSADVARNVFDIVVAVIKLPQYFPTVTEVMADTKADSTSGRIFITVGASDRSGA